MTLEDLHNFFSSVLRRLENEYQVMSAAFDQPQLVLLKGIPLYRYKTHSIELLCFLKGVKLMSTMKAATVLLRTGFVQEIGILCRVADDCWNDIIFMMVPRAENKLSNDQERYFVEFFQEEFSDPTNPLATRNKRDTVSRKAIHAAFAKSVEDILNPSDAQRVNAVIHGGFSGYVHGAYPHIMELYGGLPPKFHLRGMLNTPREYEWLRQIIEQLYRSIMVTELVSRKLGLQQVEKSIRALLVEFETTLGCKSDSDPETQMRKAKGKR